MKRESGMASLDISATKIIFRNRVDVTTSPPPKHKNITKKSKNVINTKIRCQIALNTKNISLKSEIGHDRIRNVPMIQQINT